MIVNLRQQHSSVKIILIGVALAVFRFMPVNIYNSFMNLLLRLLDRETLRYHSSNLIECIKFNKKCSAKYKNTNDEVAALLARMPALKLYKIRLFTSVTSHRRKSSLKI